MDLSVIILSYNTKDITDICLSKVEASKIYCQKKMGNKIEILVLDNASKDGSPAMIRQNHPSIKLTASFENTGFSKGNNLIMKEVKTPYILLLNSDCYLEEESLYKALAYFRVNKNCDALGARLNYSTGNLQPSAGNLPNPLNIIFWILGLSFLFSSFHPKNKNYFSKNHQVGWIMGAFFMLKKEIFDTTDGFDEKIFMHMEEIEWCKRIYDFGYKIWYVPSVSVIHLHGASTNFDLGSSYFNELKGIKYYLQKHYGIIYYPVKLFLILGLIMRVIVFSLLFKTQRAKIYMKGLSVV
ncbi:hypothetical protein A3C59_00070 [Candidatus Daviesbacteria bacterium RIFCSPHIGHO2_02_FULL_36_13]|uniref:Glycosyltransferase 2-like domain-containing protein n=1 Tax=Candidatus Daviesbacteria bacterium RIFCSPHIGHO2_02_FULL_36_13 TaxID=1797768 RepID=A0A1F5JYB8_9BACT|nr:MAG: hypothetical protein A3C59_00070 [Candidatus Daviesbacteria bacterium RIFCSPHIGHO2_02_FULL_36_13]